MNSKIFASLAILALAGCASYTQYPVTYQVPIGPAQITNDFGPPNLVVNAVQDVPARPGAQLYYQVVSPINVMFYAFDKISSAPGGPILSQLQGTSFYSSVVPTGSKVEFVFSAVQPITGGSIQLTVSDRPMISSSSAIPYTNPGTPMGAAAMQPPVTISPTSVSIAAGQSVTFTASGGAGTGNFVWGGAAPATGWSNMYTFNAPGTYTISVYRAGDNTYGPSNSAEAAVTVSPPANYPSNPNYPPITVTPVR